MTNREKLMELLKQQFPKMWMKTSEEFADSFVGGIWTGENSYDNEELPMFDYHSEDYKEILYVMGVRKTLADLLQQHGWFCEFYDSGTVFIYPN